PMSATRLRQQRGGEVHAEDPLCAVGQQSGPRPRPTPQLERARDSRVTKLLLNRGPRQEPLKLGKSILFPAKLPIVARGFVKNPCHAYLNLRFRSAIPNHQTL